MTAPSACAHLERGYQVDGVAECLRCGEVVREQEPGIHGDVLRALALHQDQPPAETRALAELRCLRSAGHAAGCQCKRCPELRRQCCAAGLAMEVQ